MSTPTGAVEVLNTVQGPTKHFLVNYQQVPVAQGGAGTTVIKAAVAGSTVFIHEVNLSLSAGGTIVLQDSDGTAWATWDVAATGHVVVGFVPQRTGARSLTSGKGLSLVSTGGAAKGFITYSIAVD